MNPTYDFTGEVALVTGAASGMGLATARAFAEAGAAVVLADVDEQALRDATAGLTALGHQTLGVVCHVADEGQVAAMVERTVATFGRLDMAFNNAGIQVAPTHAADIEGPDPLVIVGQDRQVRVRHRDPHLGPTTPARMSML